MNNINKKNLLSYGLLAFCLSFIGIPIYIYLPNYYAENFSLSFKTIAVILLISRLVDTFQDPIIGILSEKYSTKRKKFICYFCPLLGLSFLLLYYPLTSSYIEIWLGITLILTYSFFSIIYINYQSYAINLSYDYHFKTTIIKYREVAFIIGIIFAAILPAILFSFFSQKYSFFIIAVVFLILVSLFGLIFHKFAPNIKSINHNKINIFKLLRDENLRKYLLVFFFNAVAASIPAILILFFIDNILNAKNFTAIFMLLYFLSLLIGAFLWSKISEILNDKIKTFLYSIFLTIIIFGFCYFLGEGDIYLYGIICIISGIGFGGDLVLGYSILTDIIQESKLEKYQTTIFGIVNFLLKFSLTFSSVILIYLIGHYQGEPEAKNQFTKFSYALLPLIFRIIAGINLYKNFYLTRN